MVCQISGGPMEMPELSGPRLPGSATGSANKPHFTLGVTANVQPKSSIPIGAKS